MKAKNRIITAVLLSAGAAVGTALINKYIKMSAVSRNLLAQPEPRCYRWRLGNIYYTKTGTGKPLETFPFKAEPTLRELSFNS